MKRAIMIQGAPGIGKTTLAKRLAHDLSLPVLAKDDIKECLFESIGIPHDKAESELYGRIAIRSMYVGLDEFVKAGEVVIIEAPLLPDYAPRDLSKIMSLDDILQIHVYCQPEVHTQRFMDRVQTSNRHPGHADSTIDAVAMQERNSAIPGIETISVDTTNFSDDAYEDVLTTCRDSLMRKEGL